MQEELEKVFEIKKKRCDDVNVANCKGITLSHYGIHNSVYYTGHLQVLTAVGIFHTQHGWDSTSCSKIL